jgi:hypothetical protein
LVDDLPPHKTFIRTLAEHQSQTFWDENRLPLHSVAEGLEDPLFHVFDDMCHCLVDRSLRELFLNTNCIDPVTFKAFLPLSLILVAWRYNARYLRERINRYRHDAIANPSLETFSPLTRLRRHIPPLEDEIVGARSDVGRLLIANRKLKVKDIDKGRAVLGEHYDVLLEEVRSMSTTLNNEIQLVIGSVTVQVLAFSDARAYPRLTTSRTQQS